MRQHLCQLIFAGILAFGITLTPAEAAPQTKGNAKKAATSSTTSEVVTELHQAKALLETAIHDYDGHRAKAVGEIHHALHELTAHHHKAGNGAATTPAAKQEKPKEAATTTPGETQAQSDKQLKQALQILSGLSGQIPKNHVKSATHIQNAIEELNVALKIK